MPNITSRKMDTYDLKIIKEVQTYGERLDTFQNEYYVETLDLIQTTDTYAVHIYRHKLSDSRLVQVVLVLYRGECIEYFIRDLD